MLNMEVQARRFPSCFLWVNRETMIMLGAVSHIPEKSYEAAFFSVRLRLRYVRPLNAKNVVSESISPPHAQSYVVPRWGSGPVLEGVWGGVRLVGC